MFTPANNTRTAPTIGPCFPERGTANLIEILDNIGAGTPDMYPTIGAMFYAIVQAANHNDDTNLRTNCRKMFVGTDYTAHRDNERFPAVTTARCADVPTAAVQMQLGDNVAAANGWLLDLVNAAKKKPLDEQNVSGYYASIGFECTKPMKIAKFINTISRYLDDVVAIQAFRDLLSTSTWTEYRLTRCSTGKVIHKNAAALTALGVMSPADALLVTAANDSPWDIALSNGVPDRVKAYCCIYLDAAGKGIDKWYQGNNAKDDLPAAKVRACKVIFKKYLEAVNDTTAVDAATTAAEVVAAIPAGFFT